MGGCKRLMPRIIIPTCRDIRIPEACNSITSPHEDVRISRTLSFFHHVAHQPGSCLIYFHIFSHAISVFLSRGWTKTGKLGRTKLCKTMMTSAFRVQNLERHWHSLIFERLHHHVYWNITHEKEQQKNLKNAPLCAPWIRWWLCSPFYYCHLSFSFICPDFFMLVKAW